MAKALWTSKSGFTVGLAQLGRHGEGRGSPAQEVHDGDTIVVEAAGNLSVRFLGIDTPEVSFTLPGTNGFMSTNNDKWAQFLEDPFAGAPDVFLSGLGEGLLGHLREVTGPGCAKNHSDHAEYAHRDLEQLVIEDMHTLNQDKTAFHFFMAFATEVMDGYGRFLCFINRSQKNPDVPEPRPRSYNERMLQTGRAAPYFIWPNVNPFRKQLTLRKAVPPVGDIELISNSEHGLGLAREWVREARESKKGIFEAKAPLKLHPFELRFMSGRSVPWRWVIDLSDRRTRTLMKPTDYYTIQNIEDRLFVPEQYVPLFVEEGWRKE